MSLSDLIQSPNAHIDSIGAYLDGLSHQGRVAETRAISRGEQARLYELAAAAAPLTLDYFVPASVGPLVEVIHEGKNSLPLPFFREFQKRFCRPESGSGQLFGYNEGSSRGLIGPGYYVAHATAGNPEWEKRGAIVVDYFMVPEGKVVDGWPEIKRNNQGLQVLVYNQTRDFMRRVSAHVSVGAAFKVEKALGAYFLLVREDR